MASYEIFYLLCADVTKKFKYVVGKQRIRIHILKQETEDIDPVGILDFLNQLQQNYAYHLNWSCFYFNCFNLPDQNMAMFEFLGSEQGRNSNVLTLLLLGYFLN